MSREVDRSDLDAVSDEDLLYLHQRALVGDEVLEARGIDPITNAKSEVSLEEVANTGTANTAGLTKAEFEAQTKALPGNHDADDSDDEDDDDEDVAYEDMTNDQLRGELVNRGLEVSGNKAELIARLEAADEESDEDEDDTKED